jgi:protein-disulfide isomerase
VGWITRTLGRRGLYVASLIGAAVLAGALVTASRLGSSHGETEPARVSSPVEAASSMLDAVPQQGLALGRPDAPVTLVEYADLQCPYCATWSRQALPALVDEYVRPGKLRIVFRGLAFIGRDSETALRAALAASHQDRLWHVVERLYRQQGGENAGWVAGAVDGLGSGIPGLDVDRLRAESGSPAVTHHIADAARRAQLAGIPGTPAFEVGATGGRMRRLEIGSLDAAAMRPSIDALLTG